MLNIQLFVKELIESLESNSPELDPISSLYEQEMLDELVYFIDLFLNEVSELEQTYSVNLSSYIICMDASDSIHFLKEKTTVNTPQQKRFSLILSLEPHGDKFMEIFDDVIRQNRITNPDIPTQWLSETIRQIFDMGATPLPGETFSSAIIRKMNTQGPNASLMMRSELFTGNQQNMQRLLTGGNYLAAAVVGILQSAGVCDIQNAVTVVEHSTTTLLIVCVYHGV